MDGYDNFVFYGSWRDSLEGFKKDFGEDYAKEILWNIMTVATAGDFETEKNSIIGFIQGAVMPNINKAKDRYQTAKENGSKGGRPKKNIDIQKVIELREQGLSFEKIGIQLNVSKDTVRNKLKEFSEKAKNLDIDTDTDTDTDTDKQIDNRFYPPQADKNLDFLPNTKPKETFKF